MRLRHQFALVALIMVASNVGFVTPTHAARKIEWQHLLPNLAPLKSPLDKLTEDQRFDIETIQWARSLTDEDKRLMDNKEAIKDAEAYEREFEKAGLDVNALIANYKSWMQIVRKRQKIVNRKLAGQSIRLAGYLLPLEFSDKGVTDFLLVPYVGACVHVPPPPANQIVFVRLAKKFRINELFTPVWVSGKLQTQAASKSLSFVDGTTDVAVGYHIDGGSAKVIQE